MKPHYWNEHPERYGAKDFLELRYEQMKYDLEILRSHQASKTNKCATKPEDITMFIRVLSAFETELFGDDN